MRTLATIIADKLGTTGLAFHIHRTKIGHYNKEKQAWGQEYQVDLKGHFWYNRRTTDEGVSDANACIYIRTSEICINFLIYMSQDLLIKMVSAGDANGVGKGHTYYTRFNNKNKKNPSQKYEAKKFNPISKTHTVYKQKK